MVKENRGNSNKFKEKMAEALNISLDAEGIIPPEENELTDADDGAFDEEIDTEEIAEVDSQKLLIYEENNELDPPEFLIDDLEEGEMDGEPDDMSYPQSDLIPSISRKADIEFFFYKNKLQYQVHLGYLANPSARIDSSLIEERRQILNSLAEFLKTKQGAFLCAADEEHALLRYRSCKRDDFVKYFYKNSAIDNNKRAWVSNVLNDRHIKVPFTNSLYSAPFFFDDIIERVLILKTALDYRLNNKSNEPSFTQGELADIINRVKGNENRDTVNTVGRTLLPILEDLYDQEQRNLLIHERGGRPSERESRYIENIVRHIKRIMKY